MSKWSHFMSWPVVFTWSAMAVVVFVCFGPICKTKWNGYLRGVITFNINDVLNKNKNKPNNRVQATAPKKDILIVLPYFGLHSNQVTKRLNPAYTISTLSSISRSYSKTHAASNHIFHTKIAWADLRGPRSTKLVVGTVMNSTLAKQNEDSMTGKQNISRPLLKATTHQPLLIMWKPLVTT